MSRGDADPDADLVYPPPPYPPPPPHMLRKPKRARRSPWARLLAALSGRRNDK